MRCPPQRVGRRQRRGFTLIELLVAISVMALMAVLSWRGIDGISRTQQQLNQRADDLLALQATLAQWGTDLDAQVSQPDLPGLDWDGRTLRLLRRSISPARAAGAAPDSGLVVVAWARRSGAVTPGSAAGHWLRWQSPVLLDRAALELAWQRAALWGQTPSDAERLREVPTLAVDDWQIFFYRNNAWTNPLSSADNVTPDANANADGDNGTTAAGSAEASLPDGVRLVLTLASGQALSGVLTRDWVSPRVGGSP